VHWLQKAVYGALLLLLLEGVALAAYFVHFYWDNALDARELGFRLRTEQVRARYWQNKHDDLVYRYKHGHNRRRK